MNERINNSRVAKLEKFITQMHALVLLQGLLVIVASIVFFLLSDIRSIVVVIIAAVSILSIGWAFVSIYQTRSPSVRKRKKRRDESAPQHNEEIRFYSV